MRETNPNPNQLDLQVCRKGGWESRLCTGFGGAGKEQAGKGDGSDGYDGDDCRSDLEMDGRERIGHKLKQPWRQEARWRIELKMK